MHVGVLARGVPNLGCAVGVFSQLELETSVSVVVRAHDSLP